ncbi:DNRLRE domain-containing protein [Kiritimatiellota bacterium B12222]|nr:DNRLRE domain-containing protein [Kiritimatiellota bacterium B12222]
MNKIHGNILLTTACFCFSALSTAAPITLSATDDNYVYTGDKDTNYNSENSQILVKNATSNDRIGFVKFDLSAVIGSIDLSQGATLNLTFSQMGNGGSGDTATFTFAALETVGANNEDWDETTVTYNSRPTGTFTDLGTDYNWSYNASNAPHAVTITDLTDYVHADNTVTFRIFGPQLPDTGNNPYWHSSEATTAAYRPSLTVIPEASTLGLMAIGMIAVIGLSRRRKVAA